jgi:uncharacterized protein with ATP-grasp and redox domains
MQIYLDCIPCIVRQALTSVRLVTNDVQVHEQMVREVLTLLRDMDMRQSPPAIAQKIHRLIRQLTGEYDPYRGKKQRFNKLTLRIYPELKRRVRASDSPLETAVRLAIAGNIIDFGVNHSLEESDLEETINDSLTSDFDKTQLKSFKDAVIRAKDILYLGDNAGEVVFDRLLIELLPWEKITFAVKGRPVINDATIEDAEIAGLADMVNVIENGSDAPGTILESCSHYFRNQFAGADLVIAKGQGNYETLSAVDKNIFFILKAKCPVIAGDLGCEVGEMIFRKSKAFEQEEIHAGI